MEYDRIILEKKDRIAKITLNRPKELNAIDKETHLQLQAAFKDIEADPEVRVVIITGAGRAFCAGADLKYAISLNDNPQEMAAFGQLFYDTFAMIDNLSKPIVASINGLALAGGIELLESCDIVIASEDARIGDQHANFGLVPSGGGSQRLPRLIGVRKAMELLLTGDAVTAKEAEALGLINKAVPADKLEEATMEMARKLAERSPMASKAIKALVKRGMQVDLYTGIMLEKGASALHASTEDRQEGFNAFTEKRKPNFPGR